ncbi:hypothetical protein M3P05_14930 [Sansalvadorimonas sp. 2012CJ34-2]|uniref:Uncharacterized protein n=1 Tax=Parendozoicomonas callyspongiae TaxID=2942213 RepID=A0ABT0PIM2_9GAMM|nr:hypothetical protein [Sansalvadorimonas sp. 2012CJ34-2]MCL6271218.1 hypothetical protein [Sansalvadorimonas sp. 2012CJ34-2]
MKKQRLQAVRIILLTVCILSANLVVTRPASDNSQVNANPPSLAAAN